MYVALSLRATATDGTVVVYSPAAVQHVHLAANSGVTSPYSGSRITSVVVNDGGGGPLTLTTTQYVVGSNTLYELGYYTDGGIWSTILSNR